MSYDSREFEMRLRSTPNPGADCVRFALAWLAASDAPINDDERRFIAGVVQRQGMPLEVILRAVTGPGARPNARAAFSMLREGLTTASQYEVMEILIDLTMLDRRLSINEVHSLRFLADVLKIRPSDFEQLYRERTGAAFISPGDPSSRAWWEQRRRTSRSEDPKSAGPSGDDPDREPARYTRAKLIEQLAVLGLKLPVTGEQVKKAYRRLAAKHHPDRYALKGAAEIAEAARQFRRATEAYDYVIEELDG